MKLTGMTEERHLIMENKGVDVELVYFNCTKDNAFQVFKLKEVNEYNWYQRLLPKSKYEPELVWKWVTELNGLAYQTFYYEMI